MKSLIYILKISLLCLILFSCQKEELLTLESIQASRIDNIPVTSFVLQEPQAGINPLVLTVSWTESIFKLSNSADPAPTAPVSYELQMDKAGNGFESPVILASTNKLSTNINILELNGQLLDVLKLEAGIASDLELRLIAYYGENKIHSIVAENTLNIKVTPYKPLQNIPNVYLLGDMNGWNNTDITYIMYRNSNNIDDPAYTYTGRLAANTYFKFIPEESLGTYKAYCRADDHTMTYEDKGDGAFYNADERYVTITLNTKDLTYIIEDYDASAAKSYSTIGPIGGWVNWDNEPPMTQSPYDIHQWSGVFDLNVSTAVKFRGEHDWANNWGGNAEDFPFGKAVFDGPGANIAVPGSYRIYFNDLTGHYAILKQ